MAGGTPASPAKLALCWSGRPTLEGRVVLFEVFAVLAFRDPLACVAGQLLELPRLSGLPRSLVRAGERFVGIREVPICDAILLADLQATLRVRDRRLTPDAFLRHYLEGRTRRTVLVLHSYELFALLGLVAWWSGALWLWAYLWGATLHLALDLTFNGEVTPRSIVAFYSFAYRLAHRFDTRRLLGPVDFEPAPAGFWAAFFEGGRVAGVPAKLPFARTWPRSKSSC